MVSVYRLLQVHLQEVRLRSQDPPTQIGARSERPGGGHKGRHRQDEEVHPSRQKSGRDVSYVCGEDEGAPPGSRGEQDQEGIAGGPETSRVRSQPPTDGGPTPLERRGVPVQGNIPHEAQRFLKEHSFESMRIQILPYRCSRGRSSGSNDRRRAEYY